MDERRDTGKGPAPAARLPKAPVVRLRAGLAVLVALLIVSFMAGRWAASLFTLNWIWAAVIGLAVAVAIGATLARISARIYIAIAAAVCIVAMYTVFDFARGPVDWSGGWAVGLAVLSGVLLGLAFWDFWRLTHEARVWAHDPP